MNQFQRENEEISKRKLTGFEKKTVGTLKNNILRRYNIRWSEFIS